jgi:group I intron endonuclease
MYSTGIYKIQSISKPNRCYIGSALNIEKRWNNHLSMLKHGTHTNKLQRHYNKYGRNDLSFSILITCDKEDLINKEQFFIDVYKPWFNNRPVANNNSGFHHSIETKNKISLSKKGKAQSEEHKKHKNDRLKGRIAPMKDKHHSEETKKRMSEYALSNNRRPPRRENKGKDNPMFGRHHSEESKVKIRNTIKSKKSNKNNSRVDTVGNY